MFELASHFGRLGPQPGRARVVTPPRLDLILDLVETALARRRDAEHIVPDIAAAKLDRVVVDADIAVEGLRDHVEAARNIGHQLTVGKAAGAIDRVDRDGGQSELLRRLDRAGAAAPL